MPIPVIIATELPRIEKKNRRKEMRVSEKNECKEKK